MKEETCRSCGSTLLKEGDFCGDCGQQARCQSCHGALRPNKRACIMCGAMVGAQDRPSIGTQLDHPLPPGMNSLEYREDENSKSLRTTFTDTVASSIAGPLSAAVAGRAIDQLRRAKTAATVSSQDIIDHATPATPESNLLEEGRSDDTAHGAGYTRSEEDVSERNSLRKIFRYEGDQIKPLETRFKGATKKENVKRMVLLFLRAHDIEGRKKVPHPIVISSLRDAHLLDSHSQTWIKTSPDLLIENDMISLRPSGHEQIAGILGDIENPEIGGKPQTQTASKRRKKRIAVPANPAVVGSTKAPRSKPTKPSKNVSKWVAAWNSQVPPIDGHTVLKGRSTLDKGLFGLWAIRKVAGDSGKEVSRTFLASFLWHAFEIKADETNLARTFGSEEAKGKVQKVHGVTFQILPPGMDYASGFAGL